VLLLRSVMQQA